MAPRPAVDDVVSRVVAAYRRCDGMSFCYGQGSVLTGLTAHSDIDLVMIWDDRVPPPEARPVASLSDSGAKPVQFDGSFGGLDSLRVDGWPVDVAHYTQDEFDRWVNDVGQGGGWQDPYAWPLPLFAVSGFTYGVILTDQHGTARRARTHVESFPTALLDKTRLELDQHWPGIRGELTGCVRRSDGWLFHEMAGDLLRITYITWFAAHHRYCPFPKRMATWAQRFELEPGLIDLEQHIWSTAAIDQRLATITSLVEGVLRAASVSPTSTTA